MAASTTACFPAKTRATRADSTHSNPSITDAVLLIDAVAALMEVAEARNSRTLPSFHLEVANLAHL
ncbi:hypothetical protein Tco_1020472, partial [Tanacetum coccineum]